MSTDSTFFLFFNYRISESLLFSVVSKGASVLVKENKLFVSLTALCYYTGIGVVKKTLQNIVKRFKSKTKTHTYLPLKWYPLHISATSL